MAQLDGPYLFWRRYAQKCAGFGYVLSKNGLLAVCADSVGLFGAYCGPDWDVSGPHLAFIDVGCCCGRRVLAVRVAAYGERFEAAQERSVIYD